MPRGIYPRPPKQPPAKQTIRTLRPGEARPDGEPRRYPDSHGYIRLRWRVGPNEQVEIREHRAVAGDSTEHVHHRNHNPADNRPENLVGLSAAEHAAIHGASLRRFDRRRAVELYRAGLTTIELGRVFEVNAATVWRALRAEGVSTRSVGVARRTPVNETLILDLHASGQRARAIARDLGIGVMVVTRVLRDHGRKGHPTGRPPNH